MIVLLIVPTAPAEAASHELNNGLPEQPPKEGQPFLRHPNRARSLFGLARASARSGDLQSASHAYATFLTTWNQADPDFPELHETKKFLQNTSHLSH